MADLTMRLGTVEGEATERLVTDGPRRADQRLLLKAFSVEILRELERRGYDLRTLNFSISEQSEGYEKLPDHCL